MHQAQLLPTTSLIILSTTIYSHQAIVVSTAVREWSSPSVTVRGRHTPHGPYPLLGRRLGGGHCRAGYRDASCGCWAVCLVALALLFAVTVFALWRLHCCLLLAVFALLRLDCCSLLLC